MSFLNYPKFVAFPFPFSFRLQLLATPGADSLWSPEQMLDLLVRTPDVCVFLNPDYRQAHFSKVQSRSLSIVVNKLLANYYTVVTSGASSRKKANLEDLLRGLPQYGR
jgi:hypothetical protein